MSPPRNPRHWPAIAAIGFPRRLPGRDAPPCRFPHRDRHTREAARIPAVATLALSRGCAAYPDDREQPVCWYHLCKSDPVGAARILRVHDVEACLSLDAVDVVDARPRYV